MNDAYLVTAFVRPGGAQALLWISPFVPLEKSEQAQTVPPGARWITVHPAGKDSPGQPVLVQETSPGSGVHRVIGGAGGKLNYLKLRGVKDPGEYHHEAAQRRKDRAEAKKAKIGREKELGTHKAKQDARKKLDAEKAQQKRSFVAKMAEKMGWTDHQFRPEDHPGLSRGALATAARKHEREWYARSREALGELKAAVLNDPEARAKALGTEALEPGQKPLDTSDLGLEPRSKRLLGMSVDFAAEAAKRGADAGEIAEETERTAPPKSDAEIKRKITGDAIAQELDGFRSGADQAPVRSDVSVEDVIDLIREEQAVKKMDAAAAKARAEIDADKEVKGAYNLEVSEVGMDEVRDELLKDLRTASTRAFLSEIADRYGAQYESALGPSLVDGSYGAINAVSLALSGGGLMDRMVVDVLGASDSAKILARTLKRALPDSELEDLRGAMSDYHVEHYLKATDKAIGEAREAEAKAKAIDIREAEDGGGLSLMMAANDERAESLAKAKRVLGRTLGEMEANAALVAALGPGKVLEELSIPIGRMDRAAAITRARAIGLEPGDYEVHSVGSEQYLKIHGAGMDKLVNPIQREDLMRYRESKAILSGERDEDGWLPEGIAKRPDLAMDALQPGVAQQLAEPFRGGQDMGQAIRDYIGGRTADGDAPADIIADINSQGLADQSGNSEAYWSAVADIVPQRDAKGKAVLADAFREPFEAMADEFVQRRYGGERRSLHRQHVEPNAETLDALHRALTEVPEGAAAYKPIGDLTSRERLGLRKWFDANIGSKDERGRELADELKEIKGREPEKTAPSLFGEDEPNPEWGRWKRQRDEKAAELNSAGLNWAGYAKGMGGPEAAYEAVQDLVRSQLSKSFADHYNKLNPDSPLKLGRASVRGGLDHLDMVDPDARAERERKQREMIDDLRQRNQGRYAAGGVVDMLSAEAERREAESQSQVDMFGFSQPAAAEDAPLRGDQRYTMGHAAERQIAGLMQHVGQNFRPGDKIKLWQPSMDGKYILGQRAVKFIAANKKVALGLGTGTGKTAIGLGAFTHLHAQGKARKGLFVVPSSVQGQFHGEALRYLEPGRYKWHAQPGASRDERLAAMRDPDTHFSVVTYQSMRDDLLHLGAKAEGIEPSEMADRLESMKPAERKAWADKTMTAAGIKPDFVLMDEAHGTLNRVGKENSALANVLEAVGHNAEYSVLASADPVKNDASEVHSLLQKLDPEKYADRDRFLRRYGGDTPDKREALRREMTQYLMTGRTDPGVPVSRLERRVELNEAQRTSIKKIQSQLAAVRLGRIKGEPAVDALKALSPGAFDGVPDGEHKAVAERLQRSLGVIKESAMRRALDDMRQSAKLDEISRIAGERQGKPGVVFAHSLDVAHDLHDRLAAEGHRVALLTGAQSAKERDAIRQGFHPESGDPKHDILIMSDAGAVGINAQRGQWLVQYDTPVTAMVHAQRQGRIHRLGQKSGVELIDLVANHPHEEGARKRLREKYALREALTDPVAGLDDTGVAAFLAQRQGDSASGQQGLF